MCDAVVFFVFSWKIYSLYPMYANSLSLGLRGVSAERANFRESEIARQELSIESITT
jgi:hypothetical protein